VRARELLNTERKNAKDMMGNEHTLRFWSNQAFDVRVMCLFLPKELNINVDIDGDTSR
jgi:hypothetical protein